MGKALIEGSAYPRPAARRSRWTRGYDPIVAEEICERIADGEVLEDICCRPGYPSRGVVWRWLYLNDDFRDMYNLSIQANGLSRADDIAGVVKDTITGEIDSKQAAVAIKGLSWLAERHTPSVYAAKQKLEITGADSNKPTTVQDQRDFARRVAFAMSKGVYVKDHA